MVGRTHCLTGFCDASSLSEKPRCFQWDLPLASPSDPRGLRVSRQLIARPCTETCIGFRYREAEAEVTCTSLVGPACPSVFVASGDSTTSLDDVPTHARSADRLAFATIRGGETFVKGRF